MTEWRSAARALLRLIVGVPHRTGQGRHRLPPAWWTTTDAVPVTGGDGLPVVRSRALTRAADALIGARYADGVAWEVVVTLEPVPWNHYDPHGVTVLVADRPVTIFDATETSALQPQIYALDPTCARVIGKGVITGGRADRRRSEAYVLTLDIALPLAVMGNRKMDARQE